MLHPSATKYVLGATGITAADTTFEFNQDIGSIHAVNSTLEWSQSITPLDKLGRGAYFSDCLFLRSTYNLGLSASIGDEGEIIISLYCMTEYFAIIMMLFLPIRFIFHYDSITKYSTNLMFLLNDYIGYTISGRKREARGLCFSTTRFVSSIHSRD